MKLRTLVIVVATLAALSAVVAFVRRPAPPPSADARLGASVTAGVAVEATARLRLAQAGKSVELAKQADGTWRVPAYYDLPADFEKISRFVNDLTEAKVQRLVTSSPERIARLEFKDTKIELLGADGQPLLALTLGKTPETGGGRYLQFGTEAKAYLASLNAWLDSEPKNWAQGQLLTLKPDEVARLELPVTDGAPVVLTRAKQDDAWTAASAPAGQRVKAEKVSTALGALVGLRFSDTTEPADAKAVAARAHARSYALTTFDGRTLTVALGRQPEEKRLKSPTPSADGKSGPAALGSLADLAKPDAAKPGEPAAAAAPKPAEPEFETIPAGPIFVSIQSSDTAAPLNAAMAKRAFQVYDYVLTSLPQTSAELFEPVPPPPAPVAPATPAAPAEKPATP